MKFRSVTLGCKVNQFETQGVEKLLTEMGCEKTYGNDCDAVIINTCCVTGESGAKSRRAVRRAKKESPDAAICVCGCYSQLDTDELKELAPDVIFGSGAGAAFAKAVYDAAESRKKAHRVDNALARRAFEVLPCGSVNGRTRAMMKIEDGCVNFCSYCIIPYTRGPIRSMSLADIREQAKTLYFSGYREIVVTGIEISSYGMDFKDGTGLLNAIRTISESAPGVRIHLGSLEPRTASRQFCRELSEIENVCPHFHPSLQSGCDATLERMHRKYCTAQYYEALANLREAFPGCSITTDLITGFPGETEEEFAATCKFVEKCDFSAMHVFPYSERPGTPAVNYPASVPKAVREERVHIISSIAAESADRYRRGYLGSEAAVLFESQNADGLWHGHTDNYLEVAAEGSNLHGIMKNVHISHLDAGILYGEIR